MRILSKLRISKKLASGALTALVAVGMLVVAIHGRSNVPQDASMGDMGTFIQSLDDSSEVGAKGDLAPAPHKHHFRKVTLPVPGLPVREVRAISDGKFESLDPSWKRSVALLIVSGSCDTHDITLAVNGVDVGFRLAKAQAIVESNCNARAVGTHDDVGLNQVKASACKEVGIHGDRKDAFVNAACASGYRQALCKTYDKCDSLAELYVSYNRGPTGGSRVQNPQATEYVRKIDFVFRLLSGKKVA